MTSTNQINSYARQAITAKILPATNTKPTRIKASCARGSLVESYPHHLSGDAAFSHVISNLLARFTLEDLNTYGSPEISNPWNQGFCLGNLEDGDYVAILKERE